MSVYSHPLNTKVDANQVLIRAYDEPNNRLRVDAQVTATIGTVDVIIDAASGDNIKISDGVDTLAVNPDGSINVIVQDITLSALNDSIRLGDGVALTTTTALGSKVGLDVSIINKTSIYRFNQINAVPSGILTSIISYTVPVAMNLRLQKIFCSGDNISKYSVYINAILIDINRTFFGSELNTVFNYIGSDNIGYQLVSGDIIEVKVIHNRPSISDYNAKIHLIGV